MKTRKVLAGILAAAMIMSAAGPVFADEMDPGIGAEDFGYAESIPETLPEAVPEEVVFAEAVPEEIVFAETSESQGIDEEEAGGQEAAAQGMEEPAADVTDAANIVAEAGETEEGDIEEEAEEAADAEEEEELLEAGNTSAYVEINGKKYTAKASGNGKNGGSWSWDGKSRLTLNNFKDGFQYQGDITVVVNGDCLFGMFAPGNLTITGPGTAHMEGYIGLDYGSLKVIDTNLDIKAGYSGLQGGDITIQNSRVNISVGTVQGYGITAANGHTIRIDNSDVSVKMIGGPGIMMLGSSIQLKNCGIVENNMSVRKWDSGMYIIGSGAVFSNGILKGRQGADYNLTIRRGSSGTTQTAAQKTPHVSYRTHVQSYGWQNYVKDGSMSGTEGKSKRLEGINIMLPDKPYSGGITYRTHVQTYGWQSWRSDDQMAGTQGESKRLEAIQIKLTGEMANHFDVYYQTHIQKFGWSGWAKNGEQCGSAGYSYRLEGIRIKLVNKGAAAPGSTTNIFYEKNAAAASGSGAYKGTLIRYNTHVQSYGWQNYVTDGKMAGTSGQSKRLEGIHIELTDVPCSGGVTYRTHVQTYGWQGWKSNGEMSGTSGQSKRLEAIEIKLTGEMANRYDIYYRVHAQTYGWLDWAKNGASAGTSGLSRRLEGIEIRLVKKGGAAPGSTARPYVKANTSKTNYETIYGSTLNGLQNARVSGNTRYTAYDLCDVNSDGIKDLIVFDSNGYMTMAQKLEVYSYMGGRVVKLGTIDIHIGSIRLSGNAIFVANTGFWGIAIRKYVYRNGKFEDTLLYTTKDNPTAAGNGVPANITEWHGAREMNLNTKDLSDRTVLRRA